MESTTKKIPLSKFYSDMTLLELKQQIEILNFALNTNVLISYEEQKKLRHLLTFAAFHFKCKIENLINQTDFQGI